VRRVAIITPHQGLGDHILCNGLYREASRNHKKILLTVKRCYAKAVKYMLRDCKNIYYIVMPNRRSWTTTRVVQVLARILRIRIIGLGSYGQDFFRRGLRFDEEFYYQANIPFDLRWKSFNVPRNFQKEMEVFDKLDCGKGPYIFLHEDVSRGFKIDRSKIESKLRVIEPSLDSNMNLIFDYIKVLENAVQIHVIESSFAALVESLDLKSKLFAHRYARPHALHDFRHEFTYKKNWFVILP
jgi:hypothetical protein